MSNSVLCTCFLLVCFAVLLILDLYRNFWMEEALGDKLETAAVATSSSKSKD